MMTRKLSVWMGMAVVGLAGSAALAGTSYDANVTPNVIFGSGNANGGFTVEDASGSTSGLGGVELGLRAKLRFDASNQPQNIFNSNGDGTYTFPAGQPAGGGFGFAPGSPSTAVWNFEWSINTDTNNFGSRKLDDLTYLLEIDFDPSAGTNFLSFDPINSVNPGSGTVFWDHAIGDNSTPNGGGTTAANAGAYASLIANNNVAQNSWNMEFFDDAGGGFPFNANVPGLYDIRLTATGSSGSITSAIQVQVVPVPAAAWAGLALLGGVGGVGGLRRLRRA